MGAAEPSVTVLNPHVVPQNDACGEGLATPLHCAAEEPQAQVDGGAVLLQVVLGTELGIAPVAVPGPEVEVHGVLVLLQVGLTSGQVLVAHGAPGPPGGVLLHLCSNQLQV